MCCQPLGNDAADTHSRAETAVRVLENNLHLTTQTLEGVAVQAVDALVFKRNCPAAFRESQQCERQRSFARAALAHHPHGTTGVQCQADPIHGFDLIDSPSQDTPANAEPDPELIRFKKRSAGLLHQGAPGFGFGFDECPGIRLRRRLKNPGRGAGLYDPAALHDVDPIRGFSHNAEIMGDEQQGHVEFSANLIE